MTFIKEIVPKRALSFVANIIYKEKYVTLPMRHVWTTGEDSLFVSYHWKNKGAWNDLSILAKNSPDDILIGSEEQFVTEHYWGYTQLNNKATAEFGVEHPRWRTYPVTETKIHVDFGNLYGQEFNFPNNQEPDSTMLAEGSDIAVLSMTKIK